MPARLPLRRLREAVAPETGPEDCIADAVSIGAVQKQARRRLTQSSTLVISRVMLKPLDHSCIRLF